MTAQDIGTVCGGVFFACALIVWMVIALWRR